MAVKQIINRDCEISMERLEAGLYPAEEEVAGNGEASVPGIWSFQRLAVWRWRTTS